MEARSSFINFYPSTKKKIREEGVGGKDNEGKRKGRLKGRGREGKGEKGRGREGGSKNQDGLSLPGRVQKGHFLLEPYLVFVNQLPGSLLVCNDPYARKGAGAQAPRPTEHSQGCGEGERQARRSARGPGHGSQTGTKVSSVGRHSQLGSACPGQGHHGGKERLSW